MSVSYDEVEQYIPLAYNGQSNLQVRISLKEAENQLKFDLSAQGK